MDPAARSALRDTVLDWLTTPDGKRDLDHALAGLAWRLDPTGIERVDGQVLPLLEPAAGIALRIATVRSGKVVSTAQLVDVIRRVTGLDAQAEQSVPALVRAAALAAEVPLDTLPDQPVSARAHRRALLAIVFTVVEQLVRRGSEPGRLLDAICDEVPTLALAS